MAGQRCFFFSKDNQPRNNLPQEYTGPKHEAEGHYSKQKCCSNCLKKAFESIELIKSNAQTQSTDTTDLELANLERKVKYSENLMNMIKELPPTSPIRRNLLKFITNGVPIEFAAIDFNISIKTLQNAQKDKEDILFELKSRPDTKRQKIPDEDIEIAIEFLNETIPVVSGRDYRLQKTTDEKLFALYFIYCTSRNFNPLSKTTFFEKVLKPEKIRKSKDDTICTHCHDFEKLEEKSNNGIVFFFFFF